MIPIIHRVNTVNDLIEVDVNHGIEIDIRFKNDKLVLSHDHESIESNFVDFLKRYNHSLLVVNVKESNIENLIITKLKENKIDTFFLLDVEFPYILQNHKVFGDHLSLRYSKYESIESVSYFKNKIKWLWIDTYEDFEINENIANIIKHFSVILVSPSRWGKKKALTKYVEKLKKYDINLYGIMIEKNEKNSFSNLKKIRH